MTKPVLAVMAAGMGSRYGGLKQIDPMDEYGNPLLDFSVYDALRAGFEDVVFIIKHAIDDDFRRVVGSRIERHANVEYAYQELDKLPEGFIIPEGRQKPWGTAHCVLCAADVIGERPFAAINADDYYGPSAFREIFDFLSGRSPENEHALVGWRISNTLTDYGHVSRGVCVVDDNDRLVSIVERKKIFKTADGCEYLDEEGDNERHAIDPAAMASMNFWGFKPSIFETLRRNMAERFPKGVEVNPLKYEELLPDSVQKSVADKSIAVRVLTTPDRWFGVTYPEDKAGVVESIKALKAQGVYPETLWS